MFCFGRQIGLCISELSQYVFGLLSKPQYIFVPQQFIKMFPDFMFVECELEMMHLFHAFHGNFLVLLIGSEPNSFSHLLHHQASISAACNGICKPNLRDDFRRFMRLRSAF